MLPPVWGIRPEKGGPTEGGGAGGLDNALPDPSEVQGRSGASDSGLVSRAPLQCMRLCLLIRAERVKLLPQPSQT